MCVVYALQKAKNVLSPNYSCSTQRPKQCYTYTYRDGLNTQVVHRTVCILLIVSFSRSFLRLDVERFETMDWTKEEFNWNDGIVSVRSVRFHSRFHPVCDSSAVYRRVRCDKTILENNNIIRMRVSFWYFITNDPTIRTRYCLHVSDCAHYALCIWNIVHTNSKSTDSGPTHFSWIECAVSVLRPFIPCNIW